MRLNSMTSNILHQMLYSEINVVYYPTFGLFDHILYLTDNNFFVFAENLKSCSENCRCLNASFVDLYNYDIACANSILSYKKQCVQLSQSFNLNPIIFEHNLPDATLKKEDRFILNDNLKSVKKVFFDATVNKAWGFNNSVLYDYGIPLDKLFSIPNAEKVKNILISGSDQSNGQVLANQLKQHFESNSELKCDILTSVSQANIEDINKLFNQYEIFIDLNNRPIDCLCAAASGLYVVGLSNLKNLNNVPNISQANTVQDITNIVTNLNNQNISIEQTHQYIDEHFNFSKFKNIISSIFKNIKREAKVL